MRLIVVAITSVALFFPAFWLFNAVVGSNWGAGIAAFSMYIAFPILALRVWKSREAVTQPSMDTAFSNGDTLPVEYTSCNPLMEAITTRILTVRRKRLFGAKLLFEFFRHVSEEELLEIERKVHAHLPADLRSWLLLAGYGDIDEDLSFRSEWINPVEFGALKGNVLFAQDTLGNFYSFDPKDGKIYFFSRSAPEYALIAADFCSFMTELERRDFHILEWVDTLPRAPYDWHA